MLAVAMPGAQRVLSRQVGRPRPLSRVSGLVGYLPPGELGVEAPSMAAVSRRLTSDQKYLDGVCPTGKMGKVYPRPKSSRISNKSSSSSPLEIGLGALLTAGGLLLASKGAEAAGKPAAMESAEHPRAHMSYCSSPPQSVGNKTMTGDDSGHSSREDVYGDVEGEGAVRNGASDGATSKKREDIAGDDQRCQDDVEPSDEGHYKFYILSESQAAAEALRGSNTQGEGNGGKGGDGGGLRSRYTFVIIGEGSTADVAVESILRIQPEAEILFLSDQKPSPADEHTTHTGSYESDFRLLKTDLLASFNQWRRHLTFRTAGFDTDVGSDDGKAEMGAGEEKIKYGLSKGKEIRYHKYQIFPTLRNLREFKSAITTKGHTEVEVNQVEVYEAEPCRPVPCLTAAPTVDVKPHGLVIDPERRCVRLLLDDLEIFYDKCLIANTGHPRDHNGMLEAAGVDEQDGNGATPGAVGSDKEGRTPKLPPDTVNKLMSLQDFVSLELLERKPSVKHVTVLGGGFVGCEVALALARRGQGKDIVVSQVYSERAPLQYLLPGYLGDYMQNRLAKAGVTPVGESSLKDLRYNSNTKRVEGSLKGAFECKMETDYIVVASTHIDPKVDAARDSGLEIDQSNGGIVVNGLFEAVHGVYAAGSAASYFDPIMGRRRVATHDHCVNSGLYAGYNMVASLKTAQNDHAHCTSESSRENRTGSPSALQPQLYDHVPFWRSNLAGCDMVLDGIGEVDPSLRTIGLWVNSAEDWASQEPSYQRGVVYYMRGQRVAGILLLNLSDQLERAREVLRLQPKINNMDQLTRLIKLGATKLIRFVDTPALEMGQSQSPHFL